MATNVVRKKNKSTESSDSPINVIKEATCPTSSGKSILGYQVGTNDSGAIYLKIASNDGGGFFSDEWISFTDIQAALTEWPEDQGITSMTLRKIFRGKSANTPGFLIAVLCAEGLLEPMADKKRVHQACDPSSFLASVSALKGSAAGTTRKKPARKKPIRKPSAKAAVKAKVKAKAKTPRKPTAKTAKTPRKPPAASRKGK